MTPDLAADFLAVIIAMAIVLLFESAAPSCRPSVTVAPELERAAIRLIQEHRQ